LPGIAKPEVSVRVFYKWQVMPSAEIEPKNGEASLSEKRGGQGGCFKLKMADAPREEKW